MHTYRYLIVVVTMIALLVVGMWLGSKHGTSQLVPSARAQGLVVNQDQPNQVNAAAFSVNQDGDKLFWWQLQNNGLGNVVVFDATTGKVEVKQFHR